LPQVGVRPYLYCKGSEIILYFYSHRTEESVGLTEPVIIEIDGRETTEATFVTGNMILIGQTVLEALDLWVDCKNQRLIPNPEHPDHAILRI
jgi:hypothetical protein